MRVKAKVTGEIQHPLAEGGIWGVSFKAGERLTIPDKFFNDKIFQSLEPRKLEPKKEEPKKDELK